MVDIKIIIQFRYLFAFKIQLKFIVFNMIQLPGSTKQVTVYIQKKKLQKERMKIREMSLKKIFFKIQLIPIQKYLQLIQNHDFLFCMKMVI
ncbi:unnamed protein product [Paramecium primaurelia]|uniref:Uncharacterized protein n=1 Tax=Paramecium primaurelia TaxID=5886 RepID=A0A8S1QDW1_PARPR|nr:unnamed protein product [Paramecium primaurelia]